MEFKFMQTGDIHVGRGRSSWGEDVSLDRSKRLFDTLFSVAREECCDAMLITGDIFDRKGVTNKERNLVSKALVDGSSTGIETYVISGNHDLQTKDSANIDFLAEITENTSEIPHLHVSFASHYSLWKTPISVLGEDLYVVGIPGSLSEYQDSLEASISSLPEEGKFIVMGHGTIRSCLRNDAKWKPSEEDDSGITLSELGKNKSVVWWAYGDIHVRQPLPTLPRSANGAYAGSPIQMDFGETPDRGVIIVTLETNSKNEWVFKEQEYIRIDDRGFAPLLTVTNEDQIQDLPDDALIRLSKGLILPTTRHKQIVSVLRVVDDRSTPEAAVKASDPNGVKGGNILVDSTDPLLASLSDIEDDILEGLKTTDLGVKESKHVVAMGVERFRNRTYVA